MKTRRRDAEDENNTERRSLPRRPASDFPHLSAQLVGGAQVRLIDLSRRGVLLETRTRLLPGTNVGVRFMAADAALTLTGCVVRSSVVHLSSSELRYQTALRFTEDLRLCDDLMSEPALDRQSTGDRRGQDSPADDVLTLVADVPQTAHELRDLLAVNDW